MPNEDIEGEEMRAKARKMLSACTAGKNWRLSGPANRQALSADNALDAWATTSSRPAGTATTSRPRRWWPSKISRHWAKWPRDVLQDRDVSGPDSPAVGGVRHNGSATPYKIATQARLARFAQAKR